MTEQQNTKKSRSRAAVIMGIFDNAAGLFDLGIDLDEANVIPVELTVSLQYFCDRHDITPKFISKNVTL